jgi:hypothetical protein
LLGLLRQVQDASGIPQEVADGGIKLRERYFHALAFRIRMPIIDCKYQDIAVSMSQPPTEKGEPAMNKHRIIFGAVLLVLALGRLTPQFAQDTLPNPSGPDLERRMHALGLLRTINTAEVGELARTRHGRLFWRTSQNT